MPTSEYYVEKNRKPAVIKFITAPGVDSQAVAPVQITADVGHATAPEAAGSTLFGSALLRKQAGGRSS